MRVRFEPVSGGSGCTVISFALANHVAALGEPTVWLSSDDMVAALPAVRAESSTGEFSTADGPKHVFMDGSELGHVGRDVIVGCIRNDYMSLKRAIGHEFDLLFCMTDDESSLTLLDVRSVLKPIPVFEIERTPKIARLVDAGMTERLVEYLAEPLSELWGLIQSVANKTDRVEPNNVGALHLGYVTKAIGNDI